MRVSQHTAIGMTAALPLLFVSPTGAGLQLAVTVLIDIDHLLFYLWHEKKLPAAAPGGFIRQYGQWQYFGPRVHLFHNYETLAGATLLACLTGHILAFCLLAGIGLHLACDQWADYHAFKFLRIKSFWGDLLRYGQYRAAKKAGREKEYMLHRRDTWHRHLSLNLLPEKKQAALHRCGILALYPEIAIDPNRDAGAWKIFF